MKDYAMYSEDKSLYGVAIGSVAFKYARPNTRYKRSDVVPVGKPVRKRTHAEACQVVDAWCGVTRH